MSLKAQITEDMKAAMRAKEMDRLGTFACCRPPSNSAKWMSASSWTMPLCWPWSTR